MRCENWNLWEGWNAFYYTAQGSLNIIFTKKSKSQAGWRSTTITDFYLSKFVLFSSFEQYTRKGPIHWSAGWRSTTIMITFKKLACIPPTLHASTYEENLQKVFYILGEFPLKYVPHVISHYREGVKLRRKVLCTEQKWKVTCSKTNSSFYPFQKV